MTSSEGLAAAEAGFDAGDERVLEAQRLKKRFGGLVAVQDCSLSLRSHRVTGLIGPNGAGKSTVLDVLSGVERQDDGHVLLRGENIDRMSTHARARRGLIRTFQDPRVWPYLTTLENVLVVGDAKSGYSGWAAILRHKKVTARQAANIRRAVDVLSAVELEHMRDRRARELSGGQARLLAFARLAMASPEVVLLDEPLAGVNPILADRLLELIRGMAERGAAVLLVEHNMEAIERVCDSVFVMSEGRVIGTGTWEELRQSEAVVEAYLGTGARV